MARAYRHPGNAGAAGRRDSSRSDATDDQPPREERDRRIRSTGLTQSVGMPVTIRGAAWSGDAGPVTRGRCQPRRRTQLERGCACDAISDGIRMAALEYPWTPSRAAYYTIMARARDAAGNSQPFDQEWNPSGYAWNVVPRVGVSAVSHDPAETAESQPAASADRAACRAQEHVPRLSRRGRDPSAASDAPAVGRGDQQDGSAGARRCPTRIGARSSTTSPDVRSRPIDDVERGSARDD